MNVHVMAAFLAIDILLVLTPGADWAYAIAAGLRGRSVLPAVTGLVAGYAGHTLLVMAGLALLVTRIPVLLTVLTVVGAAYLIRLGVGVLTRPAVVTAAGPEAVPAAPWRETLRGAGTSGLNPKGLLLYLALLPQFIHPDDGWPVAAQTGVLGVLHMSVCAVIYLLVAVLAKVVLSARPSAARVVSRVSGCVMVAIGIFLLAERLVEQFSH